MAGTMPFGVHRKVDVLFMPERKRAVE